MLTFSFLFKSPELLKLEIMLLECHIPVKCFVDKGTSLQLRDQRGF